MQHLAWHHEAPPTFHTRGKTRLRLGRRQHDLLVPPERRGSDGTGCSLLLAQQSRLSTRNTHWRERCALRHLDQGSPTRKETFLTETELSTLRWAAEHRPAGRNLLGFCRAGPKLGAVPHQEDRKNTVLAPAAKTNLVLLASATNPVKSHLCELQIPRTARLGPEMRGSLRQGWWLHWHHKVQKERSLSTLLRDTNSRCTRPPDERSRCTHVLCCTSLRPCTAFSGTENTNLGYHSLVHATMRLCA